MLEVMEPFMEYNLFDRDPLLGLLLEVPIPVAEDGGPQGGQGEVKQVASVREKCI